MIYGSYRAMLKHLFCSLVAFASAYAHASMFSECEAWLSGPQHTVTAEIENTENIDIAKVRPSDLASLLGKPVTIVEKPYMNYIGPVIFYRQSAFNWPRRKMIDAIMKATLNPDWVALGKPAPERNRSTAVLRKRDNAIMKQSEGVEVGQILFKPRFRPPIISPITTSLFTNELNLSNFDMKDFDPLSIVRIEIYHSHPGSELMGAAPSTEDVRLAQNMANAYKKLTGRSPEVHVFSIGDSQWGRLIGHYSVKAEQ
jgi:hypothetical protein